MKSKSFGINNLKYYFIFTGVFLLLIVSISLWMTDYNAKIQSRISAENEVNARLETAASISQLLSEQMDKNISRDDNEKKLKPLDIYIDKKNNFWYSDVISKYNDEKKLLGSLSGIGNYNLIDDAKKKEIDAALDLQINFSGTAYKNTYSWIYYISDSKFIYIYPKADKNTYHLTNGSYEKISWKYANKHDVQMTAPYLDAAGTGFVIAFMSSVYSDNKFRGVVGVEINLNYIAKLIKSYGVVGDYFVITNTGVIIDGTSPNSVGQQISAYGLSSNSSAQKKGPESGSAHQLRLVQPFSFWITAKRIYLHLIIALTLVTTLLYILYRFVKYFLQRNEITEYSLAYALKKNQFVPYAQPVVSTTTGEVVGGEILMRWHHPVKGIVPPDSFISLSEKSGMIIPMTYHLMKQVSVHFQKQIDQIPSGFHIAINICPDHLVEESLLEHCKIFMENLAYKINLVLEITERSNFEFTPDIKKKISILHNAGVQFSLDDFGTGYSTHSYLQKVQAEFIKIDRSFIKMIGMDEISHHIVSNVVHLAENVNAEIVAEGVETAQQVEFLKHANIPYLQGYFYGKPVPLDEFTSLYITA